MIKVFLLLIILLLGFSYAAETSLWDWVVRKEQVVLTVEYQGRYLNVRQQDSHGYSRFYVTPLSVMETETVNCTRDKYSKSNDYFFTFYVKTWDSNAAEAVRMALKQAGIEVSANYVLPLPMEAIRIQLGGKDMIPQVDNQWRSNQDQPNSVAFELFVANKVLCDEMVEDVKKRPEEFFRSTKMFLEFTMVVGQQAYRNINITGATFSQSSFFSRLENVNSGKGGIMYLKSEDLNKLTRDIYNKASMQEDTTFDYIPSDQENQIIHGLLGIFKEERINSKDLSKIEWDSVFWNDIYSRPDIQTDYANDVFKYNESEKIFKYSKEDDNKFRQNIDNTYNHQATSTGKSEGGFSFKGLIAKASDEWGNNYILGSNNKSDIAKDNKTIIDLEAFKKLIENEKVNFRWSGTKFESKDLDLYRLNTDSLKASNDIFYKKVVTTRYHSTQKIEIKAESAKFKEIDSTVSKMYYDDLQQVLANLSAIMDARLSTLKLDTTTIANSMADSFIEIKNQIAKNVADITEVRNQIVQNFEADQIKTQQDAEFKTQINAQLNQLDSFVKEQNGIIHQSLANVNTKADNNHNAINQRLTEFIDQLFAKIGPKLGWH